MNDDHVVPLLNQQRLDLLDFRDDLLPDFSDTMHRVTSADTAEVVFLQKEEVERLEDRLHGLLMKRGFRSDYTLTPEGQKIDQLLHYFNRYL